MKRDTSYLVWRTSGTGLSCETDAKENRVKSSFLVTDLDKGQRAEVWFVFKAVFIEDEAPDAMRFVMYEQGKRYVQSGTTVFRDGETVMVRHYWFDEAFQKAPLVFREYAHDLWQKKASG